MVNSIVGQVFDKTKKVATEGKERIKGITVDTAVDTIKGVVDKFKGIFTGSDETETTK